MARSMNLAVLLCALLSSPIASGQSVEDDESETVETTSKPAADAKPADSSVAAELMVEKSNEFRVAHHRKEVEVAPRLRETAQYFASYMAKNDKYGHTVDGNRPSERATKHGYDYCLVSENIAYQFSSTGFTTTELAERFAEGWETSPGHRKNMLDPDVAETGVAVARSDKTGYWYAVQMFGRPASSAVEFQIANQSDVAVEYAIRDRTFQLPPRYTRAHTRCRSSNVTFNFPEGEGGDKTVEPSGGGQYQIVRQNGQLEIRR